MAGPNLHKLEPAFGYFGHIKPFYGTGLYTKTCWDATRPKVRGWDEGLKLKHSVKERWREVQPACSRNIQRLTLFVRGNNRTDRITVKP